MPSETDRRFSREEIQEIFRRAAERQAKKRESDDGLTLDELQQIGEESGISPEHIAAAVQEFDRPESETVAPPEPTDVPRGIERFYGMTSSARFERVLPGRVDDAAWSDIVAALESTFQNKGKTTTAGPLREWHLASSLGFDMRMFGPDAGAGDWLKIFDSMSSPTKGPVTVEVHPEGDETRVEMSYAMPKGRLWEAPGFIAMFLSIATVVMIVFGFVGEPMILIAPLIMLLLSVGLGGSILFSHRNEIEETKERMQKAIKRVAQIQSARHAKESEEGQKQNVQEKTDQAETTQDETTQVESTQDEGAEEEKAKTRPLLDVDEEPAAEESASERSSRRSRA